MAASTLLRLLKPRLLSLREHLGGITQIFPHLDIDMWGCVWMSRFREAWQSLNFYKEYFFGFETLVDLQSACNTPKRKENLKSHHMTPLNNNLNSSLFFTQSYYMASEDMKYSAKSYGLFSWCSTIQKFEVRIIYIYICMYVYYNTVLICMYIQQGCIKLIKSDR